MAYCKSCGAYIPDGLSACLACGYDESAQNASAAGKAKAAGKAQSDDIREVLERHRKLQQEKNRQWAEQEKERREQQAENRRWAQEEYARRQAEREEEEKKRRQEYARRQAARELEEEKRQQEQERLRKASSPNTVAKPHTVLAALSYLSVLFIAPLFMAPDDKFARFHGRQGLRLFIFSMIADALSGTPFGWVLQLLRIFYIYKGMTNAINGKEEPLPFIGTLFR